MSQSISILAESAQMQQHHSPQKHAIHTFHSHPKGFEFAFFQVMKLSEIAYRRTENMLKFGTCESQIGAKGD